MNTQVFFVLEGKIVVGERIAQRSVPEYQTFKAMWGRCTDHNYQNYERYGGAGVTICEEWRSFAQFYLDMGPRPSPEYSIDRYPNCSGNYEPSNCRWATTIEQNLNKKNAVFVEFEGRRQRLHALAKQYGIPLNNLRGRLRFGWPLKEALTTPVNKHAKKQRRTLPGNLTRKQLITTP